MNEYPEAVSDRQDETRTYEYDDRGNLTAVVITDADGGTRTENYTYDAVGNRLKLDATDNGTDESTAYIYNSLNQLTSSKTTTAGTVTEQTTYGYDASGNQIREEDTVSGTIIENTYDAAGQLSGYKKTEKGTVTLTQTNLYNGSGSRIQKTENNDITNYFYGSGGLLYTENGSGTRTSMNLHGIAGNVIATGRFDGSKEAYYYYHKDLGGSTTNLRDAEGTSVVSYQYTDFGETEIYGNTAFYNEICYNGAIYDKSTGHYYLNARYYDPESGRFLSQDSYRGDASRPATMNLYNYCANDPVNYDDPSGHIAISRIVGGIIGGAVGYLAGRKIAKATKAKGWKKVAIIAGCTVGGAAIGALVGPKVAKVVKKAATVVKRKVASSQRLSKVSNAYKKAKSRIKKTVSKAKKSVFKNSKNGSDSNYVVFNKTHKNSLPKPKGTGPNGGRLQSHHGLQKQWAVDNLLKYGYDPNLAPTVTIETGKRMLHTVISNLQNARRNARVASGSGKWSSSLQDELSYIVSDFKAAGFSNSTIKGVLEQQYKMLNKLGVPFERIIF